MPARTIQRVQRIPCEEWLPLCLECSWNAAPVTNEAEASQLAYEHNRDHHDGAGTEPVFRDFIIAADLARSDVDFYRRMKRHHLGLAVFSVTVAILLLVISDGGVLNTVGIGLNIGMAVLNGFTAGKRALRLEQAQSALAGEPGP